MPSPGQNAAQKELQAELRAKNAAGKQAQESPQSEYQRPHRVHTSRERNIAQQRKHADELDDEARRFMTHYSSEGGVGSTEELKEEQYFITALSLDDERKRGSRKDQDQPEQESQEEAAAKSLGFTEGSGKYFQDLPADRLGDVTLTDPNEMKRLLGPSVRFAQHAMLLAEAQLKEGIPRQDAVQFLAQLYLGVADRAYANKALREFGAATGIIDLYPLEVMKHLLEHVPSFLTKVSSARFLAAQPVEGYKAKAGVPLVLKYDENLRIRGFAIKNGLKPGYLLEPVDPPGTYHLTFATAGKFTVMLSALSKTGVLGIEEFVVDVAVGDAAALDQNAAVQRTRASLADADDPQAPADPAAPAPEKKKQDLKFTIPRKI